LALPRSSAGWGHDVDGAGDLDPPAGCARPAAGPGSSAFRLFSLGAAPVGSALGVVAQVADVRAAFAAAALLSALLLVPFFAVATDQAVAAATTQPANLG
jgi:hypothetical protein